MGVNEIKTKCMGLGDTNPFKVYFNGCQIDHVLKYKYLGNIIKSTRRVKDDAFGENYKYLCDHARKALFGMYKQLKFKTAFINSCRSICIKISNY